MYSISGVVCYKIYKLSKYHVSHKCYIIIFWLNHPPQIPSKYCISKNNEIFYFALTDWRKLWVMSTHFFTEHVKNKNTQILKYTEYWVERLQKSCSSQKRNLSVQVMLLFYNSCKRHEQARIKVTRGLGLKVKLEFETFQTTNEKIQILIFECFYAFVFHQIFH